MPMAAGAKRLVLSSATRESKSKIFSRWGVSIYLTYSSNRKKVIPQTKIKKCTNPETSGGERNTALVVQCRSERQFPTVRWPQCFLSFCDRKHGKTIQHNFKIFFSVYLGKIWWLDARFLLCCIIRKWLKISPYCLPFLLELATENILPLIRVLLQIRCD
jgi:hypothetical protein